MFELNLNFQKQLLNPIIKCRTCSNTGTSWYGTSAVVPLHNARKISAIYDALRRRVKAEKASLHEQ